MEPQDDPEARIRELERPLADQAQVSERAAAQTRGFGDTATPPPPTYGAPLPATPPRTAASPRGWWIAFGLLAVGVLALAGGIAAVGVHLFSTGGSVIGSPGNRPGISAGTRAPTVAAPTPARPPGGNLSVAGIDANQTMACADSFVSVSGFSNTVVITGHCASLTVSSAKNMVTVDAADTIDASGFGNHVTFHSGSPHVDKSGESNVVQQG